MIKIDPKDLWDYYPMPNLNKKQQEWLELWLNSVASMLSFARQDTIDKVTKNIKDIILMTRRGELDADEALNKVKPLSVFTKDDLNFIYTEANNFRTLGYLNQKNNRDN